jgi:hypothetical protein
MATRMKSGRVCATKGCGNLLSVYNSGKRCHLCADRATEARIQRDVERARKHQDLRAHQRTHNADDDAVVLGVLRRALVGTRDGWVKTTELCRAVGTKDRQRVRNAIVRLQKRGVSIEARREQGGGYRVRSVTAKAKCDTFVTHKATGPRPLVVAAPPDRTPTPRR